MAPGVMQPSDKWPGRRLCRTRPRTTPVRLLSASPRPAGGARISHSCREGGMLSNLWTWSMKNGAHPFRNSAPWCGPCVAARSRPGGIPRNRANGEAPGNRADRVHPCRRHEHDVIGIVGINVAGFNTATPLCGETGGEEHGSRGAARPYSRTAESGIVVGPTEMVQSLSLMLV
jgi:hypothetical protein